MARKKNQKGQATDSPTYEQATVSPPCGPKENTNTEPVDFARAGRNAGLQMAGQNEAVDSGPGYRSPLSPVTLPASTGGHVQWVAPASQWATVTQGNAVGTGIIGRDCAPPSPGNDSMALYRPGQGAQSCLFPSRFRRAWNLEIARREHGSPCCAMSPGDGIRWGFGFFPGQSGRLCTPKT